MSINKLTSGGGESCGWGHKHRQRHRHTNLDLTKKSMLAMYVEKESGEGKEMKVCREGEVQGGGGVRVGKGRRDGGGTRNGKGEGEEGA